MAKDRETPARLAAKVDPDKPVDYVLGFVAEQCRGESSFWNSLPWVVLPDAVTLNISEVVAEFEAPESATLPLITDQPPAPPPRRAVSFSVI